MVQMVVKMAQNSCIPVLGLRTITVQVWVYYTVQGQGQGWARILVVWPGPHGVKGQGI